MDWLSLNDLFLVGLALDICGTVLLAKGLLLPPSAIAALARTMWDNNQEVAVDRLRSRVDGEFGVVYLSLGFALQAIGYMLEINGSHADTGTGRLVAAAAMAAGAVALAWIAWGLLHRRRLDQLAAKVKALGVSLN